MKRYELLIDGKAVATADHFAVHDPATGAVVGECPVATRADLDAAVAAARRAFPLWSAVPDAERKAAVNRMADVIHAHMEELAELLTREQGKPLNGMGSRFELHGAEGWARHTASPKAGWNCTASRWAWSGRSPRGTSRC